MSRTLAFGQTALLVCALAHISSSTATAQGRPAARRPVRKAPPQQVDPQLMRVLKAWYAGTSQIKTLKGQHFRYTYDEVFAVEKRSRGSFLYQTPDKGRISFQPPQLKRGEKSKRRTKKNGTPFALQAGEPELWICDGKMIAQINTSTKKGKRFDIPPQARGRNIMEGPLPFLLGMPPDMALRRYELRVLKETSTEVWLGVKRKWKQDQFRDAKVILQKGNHHLPSAVQMIDLTGNHETVYTFFDLKVNGHDWLKGLPFVKGPFEIPRGVKLEDVGGKHAGAVKAPGRAVVNRGTPRRPAPKQTVNADAPKLFDFRGYKSKEVGDYLKKKGYVVVFSKGSVAKDSKQLYRVEDQYPKPNTPCKKGSKVFLKVYVSAADLKPRRRTAAKP